MKYLLVHYNPKQVQKKHCQRLERSFCPCAQCDFSRKGHLNGS